MTKLVKIGPVYVNLDMVAAIDTENMTISINTGVGLDSSICCEILSPAYLRQIC